MQMTSYLQDKQLTIALQGEIDHHGAKATLRTVAEPCSPTTTTLTCVRTTASSPAIQARPQVPMPEFSTG